jgi:hypothetical protein
MDGAVASRARAQGKMSILNLLKRNVPLFLPATPRFDIFLQPALLLVLDHLCKKIRIGLAAIAGISEPVKSCAGNAFSLNIP